MTFKISRRDAALGAGTGLLGMMSGLGTARAAAIPLTIANTTGAENLLMAEIMREQKFMESFGIDPNMMQVADGSKILAGIVGGSIQFTTMSGFGQVFPAIERGASLKILAGGALPPTLALFTSNPAVKSLKDLEGRSVGTGSIGALTYQLTVTLLSKYGVDISKVTFVNIGSSNNIFKAVVQGTIDAGTGEAALIEEADKFHVRPIPNGNMTLNLTEYTYQGAWVSDQMIAKNRDALVKTLAAYAKLYRFVQNPASRDVFFKAQGTIFKGVDATSPAVWDYIQKYKPYTEDLVLSPARMEYMQKLNVGFKTQTKILPFDKVADMSIAQDAIKLLDSKQ